MSGTQIVKKGMITNIATEVALTIDNLMVDWSSKTKRR